MHIYLQYTNSHAIRLSCSGTCLLPQVLCISGVTNLYNIIMSVSTNNSCTWISRVYWICTAQGNTGSLYYELEAVNPTHLQLSSSKHSLIPAVHCTVHVLCVCVGPLNKNNRK